MKVKTLHKAYEVERIKADQYEAKEHKGTYFEMLFVLSGTGLQIINSNRLPYREDKLFLIFPKDTHGFEIAETTHFFSLRFNESYLSLQSSEWLKKLEYIFHNHDHMPGCILKNIPDKALIRALAEAILREKEEESFYRDEVVQQLVNTFITIAARNISLKETASRITLPYPTTLQGYIHRNIYNPELLKAESFAAAFNISPTYLGELFRKQTNEPLRHYIDQYRVKLIEARLKHTDIRLGEIAAEFGLSDTSHLNKLFYRYKGLSPSDFRKRSKI